MAKSEKKSNGRLITELDTYVKTELTGNLVNIGKQVQQLMFLQRQVGLQIETILRIVDDDKHKMRAKFNVEFKKTVEFADFIQSLVNGINGAKSIKEKIQLIREWNKEPEHVQFHTDYIDIRGAVQQNTTLFEVDEIRDLGKEFNFETDDLVNLKLAEQQLTTEEPLAEN